ncbi:serine hydrolase [Nonomuraea angiospora]|uniref:serine hydrolase n=1 Tax=Nonomuraea angiospora TaxID=46172 RepID=UPI00344D0469
MDDPLGTLMPDLNGYQLAPVTVHQLLTHTAGVPLRANLKNLYGADPDQIRHGVLREPLHRPPGQAVEYPVIWTGGPPCVPFVQPCTAPALANDGGQV